MSTNLRAIVTGHTSGIGKAFYDLLTAMGYKVRGYSRTNGYDIGKLETQKHIFQTVMALEETDLFINNAHDVNSYAQTQLLLDWSKLYNNDPTKTIVCLGSLSTNTPVTNDSMLHYVAKKAALQHLCKELQSRPHKCRYVMLRPGFVDTPLVAALLDKSKHGWLSPMEVAMATIKNLDDKLVYTRELVLTGRLLN